MECSCSCSGICTESFRLEKNFKAIRPDHYLSSAKSTTWPTLAFFPGTPLSFPSASEIKAEFLYLKLMTNFFPHNLFWTIEGTALSSWVAGVFGWSCVWLDKPMAGSRKCSWKAQYEECSKAMNTVWSKHWWVSPPFLNTWVICSNMPTPQATSQCFSCVLGLPCVLFPKFPCSLMVLCALSL